MPTSAGRSLASGVRCLVPAGRGLPSEVWARRHRGIVTLLWLHVPVLLVWGLVNAPTAAHALIDLAPAVVGAAGASAKVFSKLVRSALATFGLVASSALLVHLSGGVIEMHFHFFVVIGVITLYQEWIPFVLAIVFVVLHHGVVGVLHAQDVYNHPDALQRPWLWAAIHGAFVLMASVAHILSWRLNEDQALHDPLTRLPNRVLFADRLEQALARRSRFGSSVTVLFIDLDRFKNVNDTLGHPAGDRLLNEVAGRLKAIMRDGDIAARLGGDEFAVLLNHASGSGGVVVGEQILRELREPIRVDGRHFTVNASIGVFNVVRDVTVDEVLRNADLAMYMAKAAGRGRVEIFEDEMFDQAVERAELESDLRVAIAAGEIVVHYQTVMDLQSGAVIGVEALARWDHPTRGLLQPNLFIPLAESRALIVPLGRLVLTTACRDAARWCRADPNLTIAVNISARQLVSETLIEDVTSALTSSGLDPARLILEITESVLVHDFEATRARLCALKAIGVSLAIDDFGTGYSSLSYLRHLPFDILKIDRSFIEQLPGEGLPLARSIVRIAEALQLEVVAEGVEEQSQVHELTRLGCRHAQGYLFAKPQPSETIDAMIPQAHESMKGAPPVSASSSRERGRSTGHAEPALH
jgi:diguanylate cyclase (GGDEF)-like protein